MKTKLLVSFFLVFAGAVHSQNWSTAGNNIVPGDYLGTNNNLSLFIRTNGIPRVQITTNNRLNLINPNSRYQIAGQDVLAHQGNNTNILVGVQAGGTFGNTGGFRTTIVGFQAGQNANFSDDCVFIGFNAGASNQTDGNVFIGSGASSFNVGASRNVSIGYRAGQTLNSNTPTQNVFVGYEAGQANGAARFNTMIGFRAGRSNTAEENTFVGNQAGMQCTIGGSNVAIGNNTGLELTSGIENVFAGAQCAANNGTGSQNCLIGHDCAQNVGTLDKNVIIGEEAYAQPVSIGPANVLVGWRASYLMAVGKDNVMIGNEVNPQVPVNDDNIYIGHSSGANVGGLINSVVLGANARVRSSNKMILGDNDMNVGIGLSDDNAQQGPQNKLEINTNLMAAEPILAASGLRFRDLTSASPTTANPGAGVLAVDANGDVIYVPAAGGSGLGTCATPTIFAGADGAIDLAGTDNFYFIGNGNGLGVNSVIIGKNCTSPFAKLDVLQSSGSNVGSIGIYQENTDLAGGLVGEEVIGIKSFIPFVINSNSVGQIAIQGIASGDKFNIGVDGLAD